MGVGELFESDIQAAMLPGYPTRYVTGERESPRLSPIVLFRPGGVAADGTATVELCGQGLTLVHFSAQPEPFLKQNTP